MRMIASLLFAAIAASQPKPVPLQAFYADLRVEAAHSFKGMTVYPLTTRKPRPLGSTLALDDALKRGDLKVTEMGDAEVNALQLQNTGKQYVFAMGGEIVQGAKQDRTFQNDLLIPPLSGTMKVAVFCTEHGRWTEQTNRFGASDMAVPNSVRGVAKAEANQGRVWDSIAQNQQKLRVAAPSGASKDVYSAPKVKEDMQPYLKALEGLPAWHAGTVGVAATFGRKVVAIDAFGDPELFRKMYPKLLRSYLADVLGEAWQGESKASDIQGALTGAAKDNWTAGRTDGVGEAWKLQAGGLHGTALTFKGAVLHADMFVPPPAQTYREPVQNVAPNLDIRRQQR
ncbi:MAG: hypothetical protein JWM80_5412 [Cyanobacteria bacterium RYN_339]|nr:hypothetical protein [Cyanobacteria bacterium RYN_339]